MYEPRLIGTWRSDARRTRREIDARRDISPHSKKMLRGLVGKLQLRYTRKACYATFRGHTERMAYEVVARDADSVALVTDDPLAGRQISHIHFDAAYLWVTVGSGMFREFFRRLPPRKTGARG